MLTSAKIFPFSFKIRINTIQAFKMRYITFLYLKGFMRYGLSKLQKFKKPSVYLIKQRVFQDPEIWGLVSFDSHEVEKSYIPHLKGLNSGISNFE